MPGPASPRAVDGRRLRSERTRRYIIEAYLALLREGPGVQTAAQIAELCVTLCGPAADALNGATLRAYGRKG